jgi:hypothetical protein
MKQSDFLLMSIKALADKTEYSETHWCLVFKGKRKITKKFLRLAQMSLGVPQETLTLWINQRIANKAK